MNMITDFVRVCSSSPSIKVGDVEYNKNSIIKEINNALKKNTEVILFPELIITGYTCGDLFFQSHLIKSAFKACLSIADKFKNKNIIIILGLPVLHNSKLYNCAATIYKNKIIGITPKIYLPNTREFYESRWFKSGKNVIDQKINILNKYTIPFSKNLIFKPHRNFLFSIEICEDLWTVEPPSGKQSLAGSLITFNPSASNELVSKVEYRKQLISQQSARCISAYVYSSCGMNESSTDNVYSGHNLIYENGALLNESQRFQIKGETIYADIDIERLYFDRNHSASYKLNSINEKFLIVDVENTLTVSKARTKPTLGTLRINEKTPFIPSNTLMRNSFCEEIFSIQVSSLITRLQHINTKKVVIGISGGLDSTLALLVVVEAFKSLKISPRNIFTCSMPGFGTSKLTKGNAKKLSNGFKTNFQQIDIIRTVKSHFRDIKHSKSKFDITFENSQARERTQILMDLANKNSGIVVGTGDLSEAALGWSTFNGDHMSMYHVNIGVPKTLVKYLVDWAADARFPKLKKILRSISSTPITPELLPLNIKGNINQKSENSVGPFILVDYFLYSFVRLGYPPKKILYMAAIAFKGEYSKTEIKKWLIVFIKRFFAQQFKRSAMPDGPKVGSVSLSPRGDWRMPSDGSPELWLKELK